MREGEGVADARLAFPLPRSASNTPVTRPAKMTTAATAMTPLCRVQLIAPDRPRLRLPHARPHLLNSILPRAKKLVTRGLYSKIRNPIYIFGTIAIVGMLLILQIPSLWILLVVLVAIQIFRAGREARALEARFGEEYRAYRKQTWF